MLNATQENPVLWEGMPLLVSVNPKTGELEIITDERHEECDQPDLVRDLQLGLKNYAADRKLVLRDFVHGELRTEHPDGPVYGRVTAHLEPSDIDPLSDVLTPDVIDELKQQLEPVCYTRGRAIAHTSYDRGIYTGVVIEYDVHPGEPPINIKQKLLTQGRMDDPDYLVAQQTTAGYWRSALTSPMQRPYDGALREAVAVAKMLGMLITEYKPPVLPEFLMRLPEDQM